MKKRFTVGFTIRGKVTVVADSIQAAFNQVREKDEQGYLIGNSDCTPVEDMHWVAEQGDDEAKAEFAKAEDDARRMKLGFAMQRELGLWSIWSMYEVIDTMREVPFPGAVRMQYDVDDYWGTSQTGIIPLDANWIDLWRVADTLMLASGDKHHQFIEEIKREGDTLLLSCGS
jgi:hypothetical protein